MIINEFSINHFQGIDHFTIEPGKINLIVGPNGSGKSSILSALRVALSGESTRTIQNGHSKASISFKAFGSHEVETEITPTTSKTRVDGKATTKASVMNMIEAETGAKAKTIKIMTTTGLLSSMRSGALSDFLFADELIPMETDSDEILSLCGALSTEAKAELSRHLPAMPKRFGIDIIGDIHDELVDYRKFLKKDLASAQAKAQWNKPIPTETVSVIDKELALLSTNASERKVYDDKVAAYNMAINKRKAVADEIARLEASLPKDATSAPNPEIKDRYSKLIRTIQQKLKEKDNAKRVFDSNIRLFAKTLENLDKPICPVSDKLVCKTDKTEIKAEIQSALDENKKQSLALEKEITELTQNEAGAMKKVKEWDALYEAYNKTRVLIERIRVMRETIPAAPEKPAEPKVPANVTERIRELTEKKNNVLAYALCVKAQADVKELEEQTAVADELCEALNPKGVLYDELMATSLAPMEKYCNDLAAKLKTDFKIGVSCEGGVHITCQPNATSGFVDLKDASSGEQLLATFLLMDMINWLSNFRIMLIDDLDKLDENALDALLGLMTNPVIQSAYDHIFIAAVDHADTMKTIDKYAKDVTVFPR